MKNESIEDLIAKGAIAVEKNKAVLKPELAAEMDRIYNSIVKQGLKEINEFSSKYSNSVNSSFKLYK